LRLVAGIRPREDQFVSTASQARIAARATAPDAETASEAVREPLRSARRIRNDDRCSANSNPRDCRRSVNKQFDIDPAHGADVVDADGAPNVSPASEENAA